MLIFKVVIAGRRAARSCLAKIVAEIWRQEQIPELNGGCLCGAVRYTSNSAPEFIGVCHCRDCQKFTGSAFGIMVGLPKTALQIRGMVKTFSKLADSGKPILRHFCPECGSSIAEEPSRRPGTIILNAGTLDDPSSVMPTVEIYCDRSLPWVQLAMLDTVTGEAVVIDYPDITRA
jgi:hypothetical protein